MIDLVSLQARVERLEMENQQLRTELDQTRKTELRPPAFDDAVSETHCQQLGGRGDQ